jgi:ribosomal protein S18 acetylase RimI-like enzyme
MTHPLAGRCVFCGGKAQYIDAQTGEPVCLEHSRLEVRASRHRERPTGSRPELTIRVATADDRPIIQTLALYFWNETEMDCFGRTYDMLKLPSLLLCDGDKVVGCLTYSEDFEDDALSIVMMNIFPEYNGCGGGRALIDSAEAAARERGLGRLRVATSNDNLLALYFYQRLGFVMTGVECDVIHKNVVGFAGIPVRDEIQLERPLSLSTVQRGSKGG